MNWIQCLSKAVQYIEDHLTDDITIDEISNRSYTSSSHFQLIFHLIAGITIGEYIRNRRLSLAAQDLLQPDSKIIDIAMRYQYDTQESFSKAFTRFHGVTPSKLQRGQIKLFHPLTINVSIQGGFEMSRKFIDEILLIDWKKIEEQKSEAPTNIEVYDRLIDWARKAREQNPGVFDALVEWMLDDSQWNDDKLAENEQILIQGVLVRFKEQNAKLCAYLKKLEPSGVVNIPIFESLERFDNGLSGSDFEKGFSGMFDAPLSDIVTKVFTDFSIMREREIREKMSDYIYYLRDCDSSVQWTLFMPEGVKKRLESKKINREKFEYIELGKVRFIGLKFDENTDVNWERPTDSVQKLISMLPEYGIELTAFCCLTHHYGGEAHESQCNMIGYFFKINTPVLEGYDFYDVPTEHAAYAVYSSSNFDGNYYDPAYDCTRDQILSDSKCIPYPQAYWVAEVYLEGFFTGSAHPHHFGYLFSVEL